MHFDRDIGTWKDAKKNYLMQQTTFCESFEKREVKNTNINKIDLKTLIICIFMSETSFTLDVR